MKKRKLTAVIIAAMFLFASCQGSNVPRDESGEVIMPEIVFVCLYEPADGKRQDGENTWGFILEGYFINNKREVKKYEHLVEVGKNSFVRIPINRNSESAEYGINKVRELYENLEEIGADTGIIIDTEEMQKNFKTLLRIKKGSKRKYSKSFIPAVDTGFYNFYGIKKNISGDIDVIPLAEFYVDFWTVADSKTDGLVMWLKNNFPDFPEDFDQHFSI